MRAALVAIGVDQTASSFPALRAAATGAQEMAEWAEQRQIDFTLLTDQGGGKVRLSDVYDAISQYVKSGVYDQLILYFSGHGVLLAPDCEAWLLSGAPDNPNEAINVAGSIANARTCGIDHVVVYSDACRSIPAQWRSAMLTPGTVFPVEQPRAPAPEVDAFYATLPGNPALEVPPDQASKAHRGLLTECVIQALKGQVAHVIVDQQASRVVPARPLKLHLMTAIPNAATKIAVKLSQNPDARVESALPKYLSELRADGTAHVPAGGQNQPATGAMAGAEKAELPLGLKRTIVEMQGRIFDRRRWNRDRTVLDQIEDPERVADSIDRIVRATGRWTFVTRTGFSIRGAVVHSARITGAGCDVINEDGSSHVRVHEAYESFVQQGWPRGSRTAFIRFGDGSGVVLAVLPGYVGTVVVERDLVVTVNYTPAEESDNYSEYRYVAEELEQRRAFVAVAARNGTFRLDQADEAADYLRVLKRVDPTLGIYAAYGYAQIGNFKAVRSVFKYMSLEPEPVPFDVAMLALQHDPAARLDFAPGLPMLTQGWMSLGRFEPLMPAPLKAARRYLKPSLWTTFTKEGMDILERELEGATS